MVEESEHWKVILAQAEGGRLAGFPGPAFEAGGRGVSELGHHSVRIGHT